MITRRNDEQHTNHLSNQLFTLRDWLRYAVSHFENSDIFFGHGTDNSYDEAVWLLTSALHLPINTLENFLDARLTHAERTYLAQLIQQRVEHHTPTAYLVKEAYLQGLKFYVDERAIIPRSFIAELLPQGLLPWIEYPELVQTAADICTGSGCLGVLLADAYPEAQVHVIDISTDALAVANINIEKFGLQHRIQAIQSDMFGALQGKSYDLIISNPPYVDAASMAQLPEEYRNEPQLALASGQAGLDHTHTLLKQAGQHLNEHGVLLVEIGHNRNALLQAYPDIPFTWLNTSSGDEFVFLLSKHDLCTAFDST